MARRRRRAGLASAGKVTEKELLQAARDLAEDPEPAIVECRGGCVLFSPVKRAEAHVRKAFAARDNPSKLKKLARSGSHLGRAYAATLLLANEKKLPYVGSFRLGGEAIPYAQRGKALPMILAGVQHFRDRQLRLLMVARYVKRRKLHCYSLEDHVLCTGRRARPPKEFVELELKDELRLREGSGNTYACEHGGTRAGSALVLEWKTAGTAAEICRSCARPGNTLHRILRHMATPDPASEFRVEVKLAPLKGHDGTPPPDVQAALPPAALRAYLKGVTNDDDLFQAADEAYGKALQALPGPLYVAEGQSYGNDVEAFIARLGGNDLERSAVRGALEGYEKTVVVDRASPARVLAAIWQDRGERAIEAAAGGDAEIARRLYDPDALPETLVELVQKARREAGDRRAARGLPRYGHLPPAAATADAIARAHHARGRDDAARVAGSRIDETRERGLVLAFLNALGAKQRENWRFTPNDQELAETLEPHVRALIEADSADAYHHALESLAQAAGVAEPIQRV